MSQSLPSPAEPSASHSAAVTGMSLAAAGMALYSVNDMAVKHLSGGYALHQIILIRSLVALCVVLAVIAYSKGGFAQLRTRRPVGHLIRCLVIVTSNLAYYLGLASMPFADAAAVAYTSPLIITALSVVFLRERVGPRRWTAVALGMLGTVIMLRPGAGMIQPGALLVLLSAVLYASSNLMTRHMRDSESAATFSFYTIITFILASGTMGLICGDGRYANDDPILGFLFRPWVWPLLEDLPWLVLTGLSASIGALMVAQAYRTTEAALIAPFDYTGMPMAIFWGVLMFGTWPDLTSWAGIALICGSGIYVVWREASLSKRRHA